MKTLKFYNTLTRATEVFKPISPLSVKMYCCGPTVYDYQHIGNMRTYIFEDLLARVIRAAGYSLKHVMNITDVGHLVSDADDGEDKMSVAARREKKTSLQIAAYYTEIFLKDCDKLNVKRPDIICKATEHIQEMISLIKRLEEQGMTYFDGGNVYFDVSKLSDYGKLAKLDLEKLLAGARMEIDTKKKNPQDFVLWFTKSKFENQELQWDSPWGRGYPGWHIECSAMSMKYLGDQFDIHCGGIDHIPVHHTNEIAQSEGATGSPWVNYWLHGEFLVLDKEKMSKSKGNFLTISSLEEQGFEPLSYRYLCFSAHYRKQLSFSPESLQGAQNSLKKLRNIGAKLKDTSPAKALNNLAQGYLMQFEGALMEDLNAPNALAAMWSAFGDNSIPDNEKRLLLDNFDNFLDLDPYMNEVLVEAPQEVLELVEARVLARKERRFADADNIRVEIENLGFDVIDNKVGSSVKKR